jgi:hypothetical protein
MVKLPRPSKRLAQLHNAYHKHLLPHACIPTGKHVKWAGWGYELLICSCGCRVAWVSKRKECNYYDYIYCDTDTDFVQQAKELLPKCYHAHMNWYGTSGVYKR